MSPARLRGKTHGRFKSVKMALSQKLSRFDRSSANRRVLMFVRRVGAARRRTMSQTANPDMIALARESRGLTQTALAEDMQVSQGKVSKIESGLLRPSDDDIREFSRILRYPVSFFYQTGRRFGAGPSEFYHYRKLKSVSTHALDKYHAEIDIRRFHLVTLLSALDRSVPL